MPRPVPAMPSPQSSRNRAIALAVLNGEGGACPRRTRRSAGSTALRHHACILPNVDSPLDLESRNRVVRQMNVLLARLVVPLPDVDDAASADPCWRGGKPGLHVCRGDTNRQFLRPTAIPRKARLLRQCRMPDYAAWRAPGPDCASAMALTELTLETRVSRGVSWTVRFADR